MADSDVSGRGVFLQVRIVNQSMPFVHVCFIEKKVILLGLVFLLCLAYFNLIKAFLFGPFNPLEIKQNLKWLDLISTWVETVTAMIILAICAPGVGIVLYSCRN